MATDTELVRDVIDSWEGAVQRRDMAGLSLTTRRIS
ncbi:MAG: hypothetical protein QOH69_482 [Actinomycetota bacterium]|nr:hypothetical protein [Actinomycetota bacterium]